MYVRFACIFHPWCDAYELVVVCIHVGLLVIARGTYTEVVDDISGMKWDEIVAHEYFRRGVLKCHETMDALYFLCMMYSSVRGCSNVS